MYRNVFAVIYVKTDEPMLGEEIKYEIFAKDIGLIETFHEKITYCMMNNCFGEQRIESARLEHVKLLKYEKN
ncbi:hypothetical protein EL17_07575 [Anditalea andensis]|uniref:Uncharacterized protein n=2 Tax=Anditalea andensis TaxID=1048983 RepID=A0A074LJM4_9BACT|nr:hypothetical protein EL17_07575 [Anditalea andensis]